MGRPMLWPSLLALCLRGALGVLAVGASGTATAELIETVVHVPVRVEMPTGQSPSQLIPVVVVRESATGPRPYLLLEHGRPALPADRARMGLVNYPANARYFAARGFVVLIPTRVGYGVAKGPDVEYTGECLEKHFDDGPGAALQQTRQVLAFAAGLPYVDPTRGLVVGESVGGLIAIAAASADLPGLLGTVNVAGGDGGDSLVHPDTPCRPDLLGHWFATLARTNRVPTLWMYSANDRFWGPRLPSEWYGAFARAGGRGRFVELAADKNNGHFIFTRNPPAWHPVFEEFAAAIGLRNPGP